MKKSKKLLPIDALKFGLFAAIIVAAITLIFAAELTMITAPFVFVLSVLAGTLLRRYNPAFLMSLVLAIISFGVFTTLFFSGFTRAISFAFFWNDRLDPEYWLGPAILGLILGGVTVKTLMMSRKHWVSVLIPAAFIGVTISSTVVLTGIYVELVRSKEFAQFDADSLVENSFLRSLREAPKEYQFFLHAAALKDCQAFAWSYRFMRFYRLSPNTAVNVIPKKWITKCGFVQN